MKRFMIAAATALFVSHAAAEQQFGIEVYPGAKRAAEVSRFLKESLDVNGHAYTTGDPVEKVAAFYKKQAGLKENPGGDREGASFSGKGLMVTIQNPWMDMATGRKMASTLVSIVKH